jgi:endonuclease III-like uncharacterized protein
MARLIQVPALTLALVRNLPVLLDRLEEAYGAAEALPSTDGWELVLAENVAYLVDDQRRWRALADLRRTVGLAPEQILAAPEAVLREVVAGARPAERAERLRRCAELAIAGAPWRAYPGIGQPGADRIELFTGARAVLALDANGLRVLTRLGFAHSLLLRQLPAGAGCGERAATGPGACAAARLSAAAAARPGDLPA